MEFSWFGSATNVIQTLNDNISSSLSALEHYNQEENDEEEDDEDDDEGNKKEKKERRNKKQLEEEEEEENEKNEIEILKKLIDDSTKQHIELSKQFRMVLGELEIWKTKCLELSGETKENEFKKEKIDISLSLIEFESLKATVNDMEDQMCLLMREKNEALVKVSKYPTLLAEIAELKKSLRTKGENDSKKSEEIDNLVQEYSKLAADSEKQKSTDSLRIREIDLENEVLRTRVQALEHSITELADRSTHSSAPPSPSRERSGSTQIAPATQLISETDLKQLRTKLVNLEYDLTEKNETISQLEQKLKSSQLQSLKAPEAPAGMITNEEFQTKELQLSRKLEEIGHLQSDVVRLQVEKQEAEATGKNFYEMYRNLQRELETEKKKSLEGTANADALAAHQTQIITLETKLTEAQEIISKLTDEKKVISLNLETKSVQCQEISLKLEGLQNEKIQLQASTASDLESTLFECRSKIENLEKERASLISSHQDALKKLQSEMEVKLRDLETVRSENVQLTSQLSSSSSEKDSCISELRSNIETLEKTRAKLLETHQQDLQQLRIDLETQHLSNADGEMKKAIENLTSNHQEQLEKIRDAHQSELSNLMNEITRLKEQALQSNSEFHEEKDKLRKHHEQSIRDLQEKIRDSEVKHLAEVDSLRNAHEESLRNLQERLTQEGVEISERNVSEALLRAEEKHTTHLNEQKGICERDTLIRIQETIREQQQLQQVQLQHQKETLEKEKSHALLELTLQLQEETEGKIMELNAQQKQELASLKASCDAVLESSLQRAQSEHDEKINILRSTHAREIERLQADHRDVVESLNDEINQLKGKLQAIESVHAENLRKELNALTVSKDTEKENAVQNVRSEMQSLVETAYTQRDEYLALYTKENKTRKALHNKLMDIQGNIRVICRVRPILEVERRSGEGIDATEILSDEDIIVHRDASTKNKFEFDRVLPPGTPQETVFEAVQPLVISVLDGYNVCIFAYGQTGSGKTFTMEGYGTDIGVSPRAISELFNVVNNCAEDWNYTISFSSLEIYNESIRDLLDNSGTKDKLDVRQTPEGNTVPGLTEISVVQPDQVLELMRQSQTNRAVGAHDMNEHSSRSHSILTLTCRGKNLRDGSTTFGKLHLIDLAGSERVGKTDATGERLKEAQNINRSLSALGDVINSLGKKSAHVPYRNSKLTFLLQDSLGGNSKVLMFVNISPAVYNVGESICSLGFAARCRSLELGQAKKQSDKSAEPVKKAASSANLLNTSTSSDSGLTTPAKTPASSTVRRPTIAPSTRK